MKTFLKEKPAITEAVLRAFEHTASLRRGDVLTWESLEAISGFKRYSQHWSAFINRLRNKVLNSDRGIRLAAITNVGLKLLTQSEQVHDQNRTKRARRQLNRNVKELTVVPDAGLSDHDRMVKHRRIDVAKIARLEASRAIRVAAQLAQPSKNDIPRVRQKA